MNSFAGGSHQTICLRGRSFAFEFSDSVSQSQLAACTRRFWGEFYPKKNSRTAAASGGSGISIAQSLVTELGLRISCFIKINFMTDRKTCHWNFSIGEMFVFNSTSFRMNPRFFSSFFLNFLMGDIRIAKSL